MQPNKTKSKEILYNEVINNISGYQKLVLAFSGGLDSTVLLDILHTIITNQKKFKDNNNYKKITLRAIHIHHGLSHHSDAWAHHCLKECKKRDISLNLIHIYCIKNNNIECIARNTRYQHLLNNLYSEEILLTAHHLYDQAETFLLALKRGSGPSGLSSMPQKKTLYNHQLLRPLLQCTKEQIKTYAHNKKLTWITDHTNKNTRFDRNFLRLNILPILKNRWPRINYTIARSAQLCAEQEKLLDELLKQELGKLHYYDNSLLLQPLIQMTTEKKNALLRKWLSNFNVQMPSFKKLHHIWKNIVLSKQDAIPILHLNKYLLLRRFQNRLYITSNIMQLSLNNLHIHWKQIHKTILLPQKLGILISIKFSNTDINLLKEKKLYSKKSILSKNVFSYNDYNHNIDKILGISIVRTPYKKEIVSIKFQYICNDIIHIIGRKHGRKLKKIWQEHKIPPWTRKMIPLLFYDNKLITALGVFITQDGNIKKMDKTLGIYWLQQNKQQILLTKPEKIT